MLADVENWIKERYIVLVKELGNKPFRLEDAEKVLKKYDLGIENVKELLAELRKKGLLDVEKDQQDFRRSIYRFLFVDPKTKPTQDKLINSLKAAADYIRGGVDYKVLLVFLFYKALSDKWLAQVDRYMKEGFTKTQAYLLANAE